MIEFRPLKFDDDFTGLISLSRQFFKEYESNHQEFFKVNNLHDEDVVNYFTSFCGYASRKAFIALDGALTVGYITVYVKEQADFWLITKVGEISGLMVQIDYRQHGIATELFTRALEFFKAKGLKYYTVYTAHENQGAIDFYRKNGLIPLYTTMIGKIIDLSGQEDEVR